MAAVLRTASKFHEIRFEKVQVFTLDNYRPGVDDPNATVNELGGAPVVSVKGGKKTWKLEYTLYGAGQYEASISGNLIYRGDELQRAQRATALIADVIQRTPTAVKHENTEISITAGATKEEVTAKLGQPLKSIMFGDKTILKYADITIEFVNDRVVDVKTN